MIILNSIPCLCVCVDCDMNEDMRHNTAVWVFQSSYVTLKTRHVLQSVDTASKGSFKSALGVNSNISQTLQKEILVLWILEKSVVIVSEQPWRVALFGNQAKTPRIYNEIRKRVLFQQRKLVSLLVFTIQANIGQDRPWITLEL